MAKIKSIQAAVRDDERWKVEDDLRVLMAATQIKDDQKRYAKAQALAKEKMLEAAKVASVSADEE